jgi:serine protease
LNSQNRQQVFAFLDIQAAELNRRLYRTEDETTQLKLDTLRVIQALKTKPGIRYAEPNYIRQALFVPNDTYYGRQWHYPLINLPQAWDITRGSTEVVVAVVDTGILSSHPDIDSLRLTDGYDFISDPSIARDGDGIDPDPEDPGDDMQGGSSFHGTHVAGTVAAATDNSTGVAGVAPNVRIMPLRVLGKGGGTSADIIQALEYAAGLANDSGTLPGRKADIINMSLGGPSRSQAEQEVITAVRGKGIVIVAAAGNSASSLPSYPAAYDGVVSVSAVDAAKNLAPYSNFDDSIDAAAPGGNLSKDVNNDGYGDGVLSTSGDDSSGVISSTYSFSNGTSMAAPHMAGVVALMKSVYPMLKPAEVDALLAGGHITQDLGAPGRDNEFGYGLIDAYLAVAAVQKGIIPSALIVSPPSLNFKASLDGLSITAETIGTDSDIFLQSAQSDADWLSISPDVVDDDGFGAYTVSVDRTGLPDGPYYGTLFFDSNQNDVEIPVSMQVGNTAVAGDSGYHYILLLDAATFEWVDQLEVGAIDGRYPFTFRNLPAGEYVVFAGTDSDNDYVIGDAGEAFGAYISLDQPRVITLRDPVSEINFTTSFIVNLPAGAFELNRTPLFLMKRTGISTDYE